MTQIVTRFAPSPTGYLHVGGARTALFNWLFARGRGGRFLLRIEDTDRARSTPEATEAILKGLTWLGLDWDGEPVSQFERKDRHAEVARQMLERGSAYKCFSTTEEIAAWREANPRQPFLSPWRDATDLPDAPYAIRLKAPRDGETVIDDQVQGAVRVANDQLDDMVLLRSDGTPTYMLAVVAPGGGDDALEAGADSFITGVDTELDAHLALAERAIERRKKRTAAEAALSERAWEFRTVADHERDLIAVLRAGSAFRYAFVNRTLAAAMGLPVDYVVGKTVDAVPLPLDDPSVWSARLADVVDRASSRV